MNPKILYTHVSKNNGLDRISNHFCKEHGDNPDGTIPDDEYDQLYDLLGTTISKYGTYTDDGDDAEFMGSRYVDQVPHITLVADDHASPAIALKAALETIGLAHRPIAISFDYYPDDLLVLPPNLVYSTFDLERLMLKEA